MAKRPDLEVVLVTKSVDERIRTKIGVGWKMFDDGTINIVLQPGTVLDWKMSYDYFISIVPIKKNNEEDSF